MIGKFFFIFVLLLILPDLFIFKTLIMQLTARSIKYLYFIPSILLLAGLIFIKISHAKFLANNDYYIGWFVLIYMFFTIPKLIYMICMLLDAGFKMVFNWHTTAMTGVAWILPLFTVFILLYGTLVGRTKFEIKDIAFLSEQLPAEFDGYKIVQLSDFHVGSWKGKPKILQKIVSLVNDQSPDLIVFTGDLVNLRASEANEFREILAGLRARDGVYSVLGNHDYGYYYPWDEPEEQVENLRLMQNNQAWMGWQLLNNDHVYLYRGNDSIALIGVENWGSPPFEGRGDLKKAMEGVKDGFQILLSHNPTHWEQEIIPLTDINLTLAGHTHALQFEIFNFSPASFVYDQWGGMYTDKNQSMYVNVGVGNVGYPFRYGAWPEITVITLRKKSNN